MIREIFHDPELAVAIAFVIAIVLVSKRAWQVLAGMLDERAAKIKAELDEARVLGPLLDAVGQRRPQPEVVEHARPQLQGQLVDLPADQAGQQLQLVELVAGRRRVARPEGSPPRRARPSPTSGHTIGLVDPAPPA